MMSRTFILHNNDFECYEHLEYRKATIMAQKKFSVFVQSIILRGFQGRWLRIRYQIFIIQNGGFKMASAKTKKHDIILIYENLITDLLSATPKLTWSHFSIF